MRWSTGALALALVGPAGCGRAATSRPPAPTPPATETGATETATTATTTTIGALSFRGAPPTNLVVISIDTARRDRFGRWAAEGAEGLTPWLDGWLEQAVVLDAHRSCANWTAPSMTCALGGVFPIVRGFWPNSHDALVPGIPAALETLADLAHAAGSATELVTTNPVLAGDSPLVGGFDALTLQRWKPAGELAPFAVERAAALVQGGAPFYLHVHLMDLHDPYCPPEGYRDGLDALPDPGFSVCGELVDVLPHWPELDPAVQTATVAVIDQSYRNEVRYLDDSLAALWVELEATGALDDALVVMLTDHGEQFDERGDLGHGNDLYAEENRAFAAFWAHNLTPASWPRPTWHPDVAATVAATFGWTWAEPIDGLVLGAAPADRITPYASYFVGSQLELGVATADRALLYDWTGRRTLYRTDADPAERTDVYTAADPDTLALWGSMSPLVRRVSELFPHFGAPVDAGP